MIHSTSFLYDENLPKETVILCTKEGKCADFRTRILVMSDSLTSEVSQAHLCFAEI